MKNQQELMKQEFWQLVEKHRIPIGQLSQICNAPIKVLLTWAENEAPSYALESLKKHLGEN